MQSMYAVNLFDFAFAPGCCHCAPTSMQSHCRTFKIVVKHAWTGTTASQCVRRREYTQPSLIRPFLIRSPSSTGHLPSDVAMVNMVLTCTETHMLGHVRMGACTCIMYMYVCMYVCMYACTRMRFILHSELRAYPSYGHPPRRRCPDK